MSSLLVVERDQRVLHVTLNRPEKRNALNEELCKQLLDAFDEAESDSGIGAILLDAKGNVFCSGMDLDEALEAGPTAGLAIHEQLFTIGTRISKPIICAVSGPAIAGGMGLVANAHIVIAAHGASFGITELRIGMWPYLISRALVNAMGERRTLELTLSTRIFGAGEAREYGLVHHVLPPIEVDERALSIAQQVAESSPVVMRFGMAYTHQARLVDGQRAGQVALALRAENFRHPDFAEGVRALKEKRRPEWPSLEGKL